MTSRKRITNEDVLQEVVEMKVAICGHPDVPDDSGLFGDVKFIRDQVEKQNGRIDEHDVRLGQIDARCQERYDSNPLHMNKWKLGGISGGSISILAGVIYGIGQLAGWW